MPRIFKTRVGSNVVQVLMLDPTKQRLIDLPIFPDETAGPADDVFPINMLLTHEQFNDDQVTSTDLVCMAKRRRMSIPGLINSLLCAERDRQAEHVSIHGEPLASQMHFLIEDLADMPTTTTADLNLSHLIEE